MPRRLRCNTGGYAFHVLYRAVGRAALFHKDDDYAAFETAPRQAKEQRPVRFLAYTLTPNRWRWVLRIVQFLQITPDNEQICSAIGSIQPQQKPPGA